jgi:2,4-dichlorophenol 6-monooxygenase
LATYGVRTHLVRDLGIEQEALEKGTPSHLMGDTVFATSLLGDEIGRIRTWGHR